MTVKISSHSKLHLENHLRVLGLLTLALIAFWPVLNSHPLMDDHFFFSWLEKTSFRDALWQHLTGNWNLDFLQIQFYRPVAGLCQAAMYRLFNAYPLPHHLLNLFLHAATSLLAGILAYRLNNSAKAGWLVSSLILLHPRSALGVSLIFNFYDPLAAFLMVLSLVSLHATLREWGRRPAYFKLALMWLSFGLALGSKEVALPFIMVLLLAEFLWKTDERKIGRVIIRQTGSALLLMLYLLARTRFLGHPFRTNDPRLGFAFPTDSFQWALLWDGLLLGSGLVGVLVILRWQKVKDLLPQASVWMLLWSVCMLLPAVHFCSLATLRPWFFDDRYWYVPLVPLTVFAGSLLSQQNTLSSGLGASILALTFPGLVGVFLTVMIFIIAAPVFHGQYEEEVKRTLAILLLAAITLLLGQQCFQISLRADDAERLHSQIKKTMAEVPSKNPIALLDFTEKAVEPRLPFNGDLQWLLTPPFFSEDISERLFFAYPTWDSPPTNRFWDRQTPRLLRDLEPGQPVQVYCWNAKTLELTPDGSESRLIPAPVTSPLIDPISMELNPPFNPPHLSPEEEGMVWESQAISYDPKSYRFVGLTLSRLKPAKSSSPLHLQFHWISQRSDQWNEAKEIQVQLELPTPPLSNSASKVELWIFPGGRVDWLLGEKILRLRVAVDQRLYLDRVQLASELPLQISKEALHSDHYVYPQSKFIWVAESWWKWQE